MTPGTSLKTSKSAPIQASSHRALGPQGEYAGLLLGRAWLSEIAQKNILAQHFLSLTARTPLFLELPRVRSGRPDRQTQVLRETGWAPCVWRCSDGELSRADGHEWRDGRKDIAHQCGGLHLAAVAASDILQVDVVVDVLNAQNGPCDRVKGWRNGCHLGVKILRSSRAYHYGSFRGRG